MLILASKSPRRKELIKKITTEEVQIIPSNIDESKTTAPAEELPGVLSKLKAEDVFSSHQNDKVLACDTIVVLNGEIMGKPHTEENAKKMLRKLSGKKHLVISGWTLISKEKSITRTVKTEVYFNKLSDELIDKYVASGSPMDKAGAYGIQDKEYNLVSHINGSMDNVIGLPTEDIQKYWF